MTRPAIGVTVSNRSGWRIFPLIALNVWMAGGRAIRWQSESDIDDTAVDGVIIGGGDDISPTLYGGTIMAKARLDPDRDRIEQSVLDTALNNDRPVLGICRGSQMLNVVLGGNLDQDAYATHGSRKYQTILPRKEILVHEESRLATIAGTMPMRVNALHSQAVDRLGEGLRVSARDEGGMIQGIERLRDPFALGVQWHPEHLFYARRQRRIFRALVTAADACRDHRSQLAEVDAELETDIPA